MDNVVRRFLVPLVMVVGVAGCASSGSDGESAPEGPGPDEELVPAAVTQQVGVVFSVPPDPDLRGLDYEVTVEVGQALPVGAVGCDLATVAGTSTVPVTLTLVHTHETAAAALTGEVEGGPMRMSRPRTMAAEPVGGAGPLRWEPKRPGQRCTDQPDLAAFVPSSWSPGDQAVLTGYLAGVPETDPAGVGLVVDLVRDSWEIRQGEPEPLTVTY